MKAEVVGIEKVNYQSRRTGEPVVGTALHCLLADSNVNGKMVDRIFVSDRLQIPCIAAIQPGTVVEVTYNRFGRVADVTIYE